MKWVGITLGVIQLLLVLIAIIFYPAMELNTLAEVSDGEAIPGNAGMVAERWMIQMIFLTCSLGAIAIYLIVISSKAKD